MATKAKAKTADRQIDSWGRGQSSGRGDKHDTFSGGRHLVG